MWHMRNHWRDANIQLINQERILIQIFAMFRPYFVSISICLSRVTAIILWINCWNFITNAIRRFFLLRTYSTYRYVYMWARFVAYSRCARFGLSLRFYFMRLNKLNNKCLQKQITLSCHPSFVCLASLF